MYSLLTKLCLFGITTPVYLLTSIPVIAEIIPDKTLTNNSIVAPDCVNCEINGGTQVGNNLFHSFDRFSIPTNGSAHFNNNAGVENIITRVTGQSISFIDGLIRANDTANFFLINPQGIVFGENASLNIGGSFIATTANRIKFADGTEFLATPTQVNPLLTISTPIGLGFGEVPGKIVNQSIVSDEFDNIVGLQVPSDQTLALVGGEVALAGGYLTTPSGRIELGSVSGNSFVNLTSIDKGWMLSYAGVQNFQDIKLSQGAYIGSSDFKGADIQMQGRVITITEGSQVSSIAGTDGQAANFNIRASEKLELLGTETDLDPTGIFNEIEADITGEGKTLLIETKYLVLQGGAQVSTTTYGSGRGINLSVKASESIQLLGVSTSPSPNIIDPAGNPIPSGLFAKVAASATGDGGVLNIETTNLLVQKGAQIATDTLGAGKAGELQIRAFDSITVEGRAFNDLIGSGLFAQVSENATGDGGDLFIHTQKLNVFGGAQISTSARSGGKGGTLTIKATDSILVSGTAAIADNFSRSNILVSAESGSTKDGGELKIITPILTVENGGRISADTFGSGKGGIVTIDVKKLQILNGGEVRAGSFSTGAGGILNVIATESVDVIGSTTINSNTVVSTLFSQAEASGNAGNLNINTPELNVRDQGTITVSGRGNATAGNLTISSKTIRLNRGNLKAETNTGSGANIILKDINLLILNNQSLISATAFNNADGGNIDIDATNGFIVVIPEENSDITANAFAGKGGNIQIITKGIFGIESRSELTDKSDINASSTLGIQGVITINAPDNDGIKNSLTELPNNLIDTNTLIANSCIARSPTQEGTFIITGSSGLPHRPGELAASSYSTGDVQSISNSTSSTWKKGDPIVEAQGVYRLANGDLVMSRECR